MQTVGDLAAGSPGATRVFERHGIDFCCGGNKPFAQACQEKQLDPAVLLREIEEAGRENAPDAVDWNAQPQASLVDHIVNQHHAYLRRELPRLSTWIAAVQKAHHQRDGALLDSLARIFNAMRDELEAHLRQEETILFPAILRSEGWIAQPIAALEHEHDSAGQALAQLRNITGGFHPPEHACATYRALYSGLADLERDLHQHIHLENNILFPRAVEEMNRGRGC